MSTFLERIVAHKREEIERERAALPEAELERLAAGAPAPRDVVGRLGPHRLGVIAEVKRASPSRGAIALDLDAATQAARYVQGGADAVSVLTDREFYHGSPEDLEAVRAAVPAPVLYKDFVLERYQVLKARRHGADILLLIVAALGRERLLELLHETRALGMTPLVEVYSEAEADLALDVGADVIGVNNRNLHTFEVALETTERLAPRLASHALVISLSGIGGPDDARRVAVAGARAVLVGEALVRAADPGALVASLKAVALAPGVAEVAP